MPQPDVLPRLLSPEDLRVLLGVPLKTVYVWNAAGTGPRLLRLGKHVRYRREDVETWLDERAAASPRGAA